MVDQIKTYTALDDFLFSDWNAEIASLIAALNGTITTTIPNGSVTELKLADGANPAVYFAELFNDTIVTTGFTVLTTSVLDVTITAGTAYVLKTSSTPNKLIRVVIASTQTLTVTDNATNHLDLGVDGIVDVVQTSSAAQDHIRLTEVVALAGSITGTTDEADRSFLDNLGFKGEVFSLFGDVATTETVVLATALKVRDSTNLFNIELSTALTADITNPVGINGLDQGTESASKWYAVLVIAASLGGLADATLLVEEANYPASIVLPTGYDIFRRVMWVRNDSGSDFLLGKQAGHTFSYDDEHNVSTTFSSVSFTDIGTSGFTPPNSRFAHMNADSGDSGGSTAGQILHYTRAGITTSSGGVLVITTRAGSEVFDDSRQVAHFSNVPIDTSASRNVAFRAVNAITFIAVNGYEDPLVS